MLGICIKDKWSDCKQQITSSFTNLSQMKLAILKDRLMRALGQNSGFGQTASPFQQVNILPDGVRQPSQQQPQRQNVYSGASRGHQVQSGSHHFHTTTTSTTNYYNQNQFSYAPVSTATNTQASVFTPQPTSQPSAPAHRGNAFV